VPLCSLNSLDFPVTDIKESLNLSIQRYMRIRSEFLFGFPACLRLFCDIMESIPSKLPNGLVLDDGHRKALLLLGNVSSLSLLKNRTSIVLLWDFEKQEESGG